MYSMSTEAFCGSMDYRLNQNMSDELLMVLLESNLQGYALHTVSLCPNDYQSRHRVTIRISYL